MLPMPPLTSIRAFTAAAQAGSVVAAARMLNVTHSAVSHQIRVIEAWLGCKLFDRHAAGVTLTEQGRQLFASSAKALYDVSSTCNQIRGRVSTNSLTLACPGSFLLHWLIPRLDQFEAEHPDITLNLQASTGTERLFNGDVDAIIYCGRGIHPSEVSEHWLIDNDLGPICSVAYANVPTRPEQLLLHPLLGTDSYSGAWQIWAYANRLTSGDLTSKRSFSQLSYLIQATIAGLGIGIAPSILVEGEIEQGRIIAPLGFVSSGDRISLCSLGNRTNEYLVSLLRDWLVNALRPDGGSSALGLTPVPKGCLDLPNEPAQLARGMPASARTR